MILSSVSGFGAAKMSGTSSSEAVRVTRGRTLSRPDIMRSRARPNVPLIAIEPMICQSLRYMR